MRSVLVSCVLLCILAWCDFEIGYGQMTYNVLDHGAVGDGHRDDSEAFLKAWNASCLDKGTPRLVIPGEKTYLLQPTNFSGPCQSSSIHVEISGKLLAPSPDAWKECVDLWLTFSEVTNLTVSGSGEINGQGSLWWNKYDLLNYVNNYKVQCERPKALRFYRCDSLQLSGLTLADSPRTHISIQYCNYANVSYLQIRAPEDSPNTDGIDISMSSNVNIHDCIIGTGDDCIAVNNGTFIIDIKNIACGPGHGISIGSLGKNGDHNTVENIHVKNCSFNSTMNGARIKTFQGGSGYARRISFEEITLTTAGHPIIIDQYYCPEHDCENSTSSVQVSDVTFSGFHGTSKNEQAITLNCSQSVNCVNIVMNNINITSAVASEEVRASCSYVNGTSYATVPQVPCLSSKA
ncbi:hypothetical protein ACLB2K_055139 [Fragaria x ananassa]